MARSRKWRDQLRAGRVVTVFITENAIQDRNFLTAGMRMRIEARFRRPPDKRRADAVVLMQGHDRQPRNKSRIPSGRRCINAHRLCVIRRKLPEFDEQGAADDLDAALGVTNGQPRPFELAIVFASRQDTCWTTIPGGPEKQKSDRRDLFIRANPGATKQREYAKKNEQDLVNRATQGSCATDRLSRRRPDQSF